MFFRRTLTLRGELRGAGVDLVARGRVSELLARRRFSEDERREFANDLEVPFAAREVMVKAVGGPGMMGAPLREMNVAREGEELRLVAGPKYVAVLAEQAVDRLWLAPLSMHDAFTIVAGVALSGDASRSIEIACVALSIEEADDAWLTPSERDFAATRPTPRSSIATRCAARLAARALGGDSLDVSIEAGGDDPPRLVGFDGAFVSLAHEDDLALALVAVPSR